MREHAASSPAVPQTDASRLLPPSSAASSATATARCPLSAGSKTKSIPFAASRVARSLGASPWFTAATRSLRHIHGIVNSPVSRMTGLSRAQTTRLIGQWMETGSLKVKPRQRVRFTPRYTRADIELLAQVDEAHETLSGPATLKILHREYHDFADP